MNHLDINPNYFVLIHQEVCQIDLCGLGANSGKIFYLLFFIAESLKVGSFGLTLSGCILNFSNPTFKKPTG